MLTAEKMAKWCDGIWKNGMPTSIKGFCIDTRLIGDDEVFIALSGDVRDGHDYLKTAFDGGAAGAIIAEDKFDSEIYSLPCLLVKDPAKALSEIATNYRKAVKPKIIAITGSVGKSTVKELIAQMLATTFKTAKTKGNWNNIIGLPLSILAMKSDTEVAVFELGMNHPGELDPLCGIVEPECCVVTNVGPVHLEYFDSVKSIADEKSVVLKRMSGNGVAVLDADGEYFDVLRGSATGEVRTISFTNEADYYCVERRMGEGTAVICEKISGDEIILPMPLPGDFNVSNVLLAVGVARWMVVSWDDIICSLKNFKAMPLRWNKVMVNNVLFVNDAYNANPVSMRAAIETFYYEQKSKSKWLVLGGMLELGESGFEEHLALGSFIASMEWEGVVVVGELGCVIADGAETHGMPHTSIYRCDNNNIAAAIVKKNIVKDSAVLLKGSREFKLEEVVDIITKDKK